MYELYLFSKLSFFCHFSKFLDKLNSFHDRYINVFQGFNEVFVDNIRYEHFKRDKINVVRFLNDYCNLIVALNRAVNLNNPKSLKSVSLLDTVEDYFKLDTIEDYYQLVTSKTKTQTDNS